MARNTAADSTRRLIALLGHLTPGISTPVGELAQIIGTTPEQLAEDLSTLCVCGVAPYGPDQCVDVFVEDGNVEVYSPLPAVSGPVRLSPDEAGALASALAATGFAADNPLVARLLAASAADFDADALERTLGSAIASHDGDVFETLAGAAEGHDVVAISYQRDGAESPSQREIEPLALFAERGAWYVSAWCRTAAGMRTFRVDRIRSAHATGEGFDPLAHGASLPGTTALASEGLPLARLRLAPGEAFVEREWPGGRIAGTDADGFTLADVPYAGGGWLARRVVARLGRVEVVGPAEMREAVRELARRELAGLGSA